MTKRDPTPLCSELHTPAVHPTAGPYISHISPGPADPRAQAQASRRPFPPTPRWRALHLRGPPRRCVASAPCRRPPEGWECTLDNEEKPCPAGEWCASLDGAKPHCYERCQLSASCPAGQGCVGDICQPFSLGCVSHADCAAAESFFCGANQTCQRKLPLGAACSDPAACATSFCEERVLRYGVLGLSRL